MRLIVCAVAVVSPLFSAQDTASSGFELTLEPLPGGTFFSASTTLSEGDFVVFDGTRIVRYQADGSPLLTLGTLPQAVFPSFILADPDEDTLYLGESSNGNIYRMFTDFAADPEFLVTLPFNYSAALGAEDQLYVSAATCGFTCPNEIWRIDLNAVQARLVARVQGPSGPIAVDGAGSLFYGTASRHFPPPAGSSSIWRWPAKKLAMSATGTLATGPTPDQHGRAILELDDAEFVGGGFTGAAGLAFDPRTGSLFLAENDFGTGANRIRAVRGSADQSPILVDGRAFQNMGNLSFNGGDGGALFLPHQPAEGGRLTYTTTDFVVVPERLALRPLRPEAVLSGPGTVGPGDLLLTLENGPPNGFAVLLYGPSSLYDPLETPFVVGGVPLFLGLDPARISSVPGRLPLDSTGSLQRTYFNPGGLEGQFAMQLLLLDEDEVPIGTSSAAFL